MTIKNIKLSEISTEDLAQLENLIQKEKQSRKENRYRELCNKIIKDLEVFQKEFPFESIVVDCLGESNKRVIYLEEIIPQIKENWLR